MYTNFFVIHVHITLKVPQLSALCHRPQSCWRIWVFDRAFLLSVFRNSQATEEVKDTVFQWPANNACSKSHSILRSIQLCPHHMLNNMNKKQEKDGPLILLSKYSPYDFFTTGVIVLYLTSD